MRLLCGLLCLPCLDFLKPGDTFPSCLQASTTWQEGAIVDIAVNIATPELCQLLCLDHPSCAGVTWLAPEAPLFPLACYMFSSKEEPSVPCDHCLSGPSECSCTTAGLCEILDYNLIDIFGNISTLEECENHCGTSGGCTAYTYLGETNHLRRTCFLFTSCDTFTRDCTGCTTGVTSCDTCSFEETNDDGSCGPGTCENGWSLFDRKCYKILNNNHDYENITKCRSDCQKLEGTLASIHSTEEDEFTFGLYGRVGMAYLGALEVEPGVFRWEDATQWTYENWNPGEPDGGQGCVYQSWATSPGWNDFSCVQAKCLCKRDTQYGPL